MYAAVAPCRRRVAGLAVLVPLTLPIAACAATPPDGDVVYCLSAAHRAQFVESAATLADASGAEPVRLNPADVVAVRQWRATHPDLFGRACAAIAPRAPGGNDAPTWLLGLVNVVAGALLATVTSLLTLRVTQRRQVAGVLTDEMARLESMVDEVSAAGSETRAPAPEARKERVEAVRRAGRQARALARTSVGARLETELDVLAGALRRSVATPGRTDLTGPRDRIRAEADALTARLTASPLHPVAALRRSRPAARRPPVAGGGP